MNDNDKYLPPKAYEEKSIVPVVYHVWTNDKDPIHVRPASQEEHDTRTAPEGHHLRSDAAVTILSGGRHRAQDDASSFSLASWFGPGWDRGEMKTEWANATFFNFPNREHADAIIKAITEARDIVFPE